MSKEIGTLVVVVLKARNLLDKHSLYKQDAYTKVTLNGVTKQTEIDVKGGQHPEWDQELRFSVTESTKKNARTLEVSCWSKEPRNDDLVGKGELDITETLQTGEFDDWIPLTTSNDVQRGDLYLEMTYYATGPAPAISRRPSKLDPSTRLSRIPAGGKSSQQYHHPGLQAILSTGDSLLAPPSSLQSGRPSPKPTSSLPSLTEETPTPTATSPPPAALPAILRPGAGRPSGRSSSQSGTGGHQTTSSYTSPHTSPSPSPHVSPRPYQPYQSPSVPPPQSQFSLDAPPDILRAGSSRPSNGSSAVYTSPRISEPEVYPLSTPVNGYAPVSSPEPLPYRSTYTPIPDHSRTVPTLPSSPQPIPPAPYTAHTWHASPPSNATTLPPLHQSTYDAPATSPISMPSFFFPTPDVSAPTPPFIAPQPPSSPFIAAPPPSSPFAPPPPRSYSPYPPNQPAYPPNQPAYAPYGPPPFNAHPPPPPAAAPYARPYPYNYPPPPRDPDLDAADPSKKERYSKPLPLPDEPAKPSTTSNHHHRSSSASAQPARPADEDRLVALAVEREEEARRQRAFEQEQADLELARKLDLELNLETVQGEPQPPSQPKPEMPGTWYRHRVEV